MNWSIQIILLFLLAMIAYQDLKMRLIHILLPFGLLVVGLTLNRSGLDYVEMGKSTSFLLFNLVCMAIYFSVKQKKMVNPFHSLMGWGDVLFLLSVIPFFSFRSYLVFFTCGMVFSLLTHILIRLILETDKSIPLAGYLSIFMIGIFGLEKILAPNMNLLKLSF